VLPPAVARELRAAYVMSSHSRSQVQLNSDDLSASELVVLKRFAVPDASISIRIVAIADILGRPVAHILRHMVREGLCTGYAEVSATTDSSAPAGELWQNVFEALKALNAPVKMDTCPVSSGVALHQLDGVAKYLQEQIRQRESVILGLARRSAVLGTVYPHDLATALADSETAASMDCVDEKSPAIADSSRPVAAALLRSRETSDPLVLQDSTISVISTMPSRTGAAASQGSPVTDNRPTSSAAVKRGYLRQLDGYSIPWSNTVDSEDLPADFEYTRHNILSAQCMRLKDLNFLDSCGCPGGVCDAACVCRQGIDDNPSTYDDDMRLLSVDHGQLLVECNDLCSCGPECRNRVVQRSDLASNCQLEIVKTEGKGWGVRTLAPIQAATYVCEYVGEVLTEEESNEVANASKYLWTQRTFHAIALIPVWLPQ